MSKNSKLLFVLVLVVLGMVGFAFANVPLFKMFCTAVGIDFATPDQLKPGAEEARIDKSRKLKIIFSCTVNDGLPVLFEPDKKRADIFVGQTDQINYRFVNLSSDTLYFRPIHSTFPAEANKKYVMIKCFCFNDMMLLPHEEVVHPLVYFFRDDLDKSVTRITMHYTLFKRNPEDLDWGVKNKAREEL